MYAKASLELLHNILPKNGGNDGCVCVCVCVCAPFRRPRTLNLTYVFYQKFPAEQVHVILTRAPPRGPNDSTLPLRSAGMKTSKLQRLLKDSVAGGTEKEVGFDHLIWEVMGGTKSAPQLVQASETRQDARSVVRWSFDCFIISIIQLYVALLSASALESSP